MIPVRILSTTVLLALLLLPGPSDCRADLCRPLEIHFFYSTNCPHCHDQMGLMEAIAENNPHLSVHFLEITKSFELWRTFVKDWNIDFNGVPRTFVGDTTFVGYSPSLVALDYSEVLQGYLGNQVQLIKSIEAQSGCPVELGDFSVFGEPPALRLVDFWPLLLPLGIPLGYMLFGRRNRSPESGRIWLGGSAAAVIASLFLLLGTLPDTVVQGYAEQLPYPIFVLVIALVDGFNPCAFTVLIILLSLLTYTRSRRDMLLIGTTFIATSGLMYFLFIMVLVLIGGFFLDRYGPAIMLILGCLITGAGLLNLKDFFFLNRGLSLSLSEKQKRRFSQKASTIVKGLGRPGARLGLAIGGTIMLGIFVNLIELGCTAILPAVYLTTLVSRFDSVTIYALWTGLYAAVYVLPLLAILINFVYVFKSVRLSETQGRLLKLLAGCFMILFGLLMVFKPELLAFG